MLFIMLLSVGMASSAACSLCMLSVFPGLFPPDPLRPLRICRPAFVNLLQNQPRRLPLLVDLRGSRARGGIRTKSHNKAPETA